MSETHKGSDSHDLRPIRSIVLVLYVTGPPSISGEGPPSRRPKPTVRCYFLNSQSAVALKGWGFGQEIGLCV